MERLVIFTDLDGTLLDAETYEAGRGYEALSACKKRGIPVVFVSSKTRVEIMRLREEMGVSEPFIPENGGAIYLPVESWERAADSYRVDDFFCILVGEPLEQIKGNLKAAAEASGTRIICFSDMKVEQITELTGLPPDRAKLAQKREFDEPFIILDKNDEKLLKLIKEIEALGMKYTRGGRFHHFTSGFDKGVAVKRLMKLYTNKTPRVNPVRRFRMGFKHLLKHLFVKHSSSPLQTGFSNGVKFAAVGDSANDLPMLKVVDYAYLVRRPDGSYDETAAFEGLEITDGIGPEGFVEAVKKLIKMLDVRC